MEKVTLDPAIKFGAGRYRQEKNLLEECGKEISRFGKRAFIIAGNRAWDAVKERMIPGFEKAGLEYELHLYSGKCSYEAVWILFTADGFPFAKISNLAIMSNAYADCCSEI